MYSVLSCPILDHVAITICNFFVHGDIGIHHFFHIANR
jgi:hypothetical protein